MQLAYPAPTPPATHLRHALSRHLYHGVSDSGHFLERPGVRESCKPEYHDPGNCAAGAGQFGNDYLSAVASKAHLGHDKKLGPPHLASIIFGGSFVWHSLVTILLQHQTRQRRDWCDRILDLWIALVAARMVLWPEHGHHR